QNSGTPPGLAVNPGWGWIVLVMCRAPHPPTTTALGGHHESITSAAGRAGAGGRACQRDRRRRGAQPSQATIKDQNNRRTLNPLVQGACRGRDAGGRFGSGDRNFAPDPDVTSNRAAPPQANPAPVP